MITIGEYAAETKILNLITNNIVLLPRNSGWQKIWISNWNYFGPKFLALMPLRETVCTGKVISILITWLIGGPNTSISDVTRYPKDV